LGFLTRLNFNHLMKPMIKRKARFVRLWNHQPFRAVNRLLFELDSSRLVLIPASEGSVEGGGTVVPYSIVEHFVREASHRVILKRCPCRTGMGCTEFDPGFGCTFLGEGAKEIDPAIGRHVGLEEALEHVREADRLGLVSAMGKFRLDALALGVRDHKRLMTVCHCCPCCCLTTELRFAPEEAWNAVTRIEGSEVRLAGECRGCGTCESACIFGQVEVREGAAVVSAGCKGCGRCVAACPQGALVFEFNEDLIASEVSRISSGVDVG